MSKDLREFRGEINKIDKKIFFLLEKRFKMVKKVGEFKKIHRLKIVNKKREADLIKEMLKNSVLQGGFVKNFYKLIFNYSYKIEKSMKKK